MQKSTSPKRKPVLSKEDSASELKKRMAMRESTEELERVKREMSQSKNDKNAQTASTDSNAPLQNIQTAGRSGQDLYMEVCKELNNFLKNLGAYAFSPSERKRYFPGDKITYVIGLLRGIKWELGARYVLNMFADRVKQLHGGTVPAIKVKKGFFGRTVERPMNPDEIAARFTIEEDFPAAEVKPLGAAATQMGLLMHLEEVLLHNEDILNPLKKGSRKTVAMFLNAVGLVNPSTSDKEEKLFVACLLTPESFQPKSNTDADRLTKLLALLKKGKKWLERKIAVSNSSAAAASPSANPASGSSKPMGMPATAAAAK